MTLKLNFYLNHSLIIINLFFPQRCQNADPVSLPGGYYPFVDNNNFASTLLHFFPVSDAKGRGGGGGWANFCVHMWISFFPFPHRQNHSRSSQGWPLSLTLDSPGTYPLTSPCRSPLRGPSPLLTQGPRTPGGHSLQSGCSSSGQSLSLSGPLWWPGCPPYGNVGCGTPDSPPGGSLPLRLSEEEQPLPPSGPSTPHPYRPQCAGFGGSQGEIPPHHPVQETGNPEQGPEQGPEEVEE